MKLRALLLVALAAATCPAVALAQTAGPYPNRPITLVVPYTPGSGIDVLARVIAPKLNRKLGRARRGGQQTRRERHHRRGRGRQGGAQRLHAHGHREFVHHGAAALQEHALRSGRDFTPIAKIALASYTFAVNPAVLPVRDFSEFVRQSKRSRARSTTARLATAPRSISRWS